LLLAKTQISSQIAFFFNWLSFNVFLSFLVASGQLLRKLFLFFFFKLPDSKLQQVAKNIEDFRFVFYFPTFKFPNLAKSSYG
jgi:hypothetical protein